MRDWAHVLVERLRRRSGLPPNSRGSFLSIPPAQRGGWARNLSRLHGRCRSRSPGWPQRRPIHAARGTHHAYRLPRLRPQVDSLRPLRLQGRDGRRPLPSTRPLSNRQLVPWPKSISRAPWRAPRGLAGTASLSRYPRLQTFSTAPASLHTTPPPRNIRSRRVVAM